MKYKLGNLKLKTRIFLAPMLEPNDIAFRLLCKRAGCGLTYTGMTSPLSKAKLYLDDRPICQLFGNSVKGIKSFMRKYDGEVSGWDFNLGCPSKLSKRLGHGACLNDLGVIREILETMRDNTEKPLTVKIRKSDIGFDILRIAEEVKVDGFIVHARTLSQGYSGEVDYSFALEVKRRSGIPVIFSGVSDLGEVEGILEDFDFVMLGRKAIGNPGAFRRFGEVRRGEERVLKPVGFNDYLELAGEYGIYFRQVKYQSMNFSKGLVGGKGLRRRLVGAKSVQDIEGIMKH